MESTYTKKSFLFYKSHNFVGQLGLSGIGPKKWQRRWTVLYPDSLQGRVRLECYDSKEQETKDPSSKKTIALSNCQSIRMVKQKNQEFAFDITTADKVHSFATESNDELQSWVQALCTTAFGGKDVPQSPSLSSLNTTGSDDLGSQENFIYESVVDSKIILVEMKPSMFPETSCFLEGNYELHVGDSSISLHEPSNRQPLFSWPLKYLRRYGRNETMFSLEAGRRCDSGPGKFFFATTEGNKIFNAVQSAVENLSQQNPPATPLTAQTVMPKPAAGPAKIPLSSLAEPTSTHSPKQVPPAMDKTGPASGSPAVSDTGRTSSNSSMSTSSSFMQNLNRKLGAMMGGSSNKSSQVKTSKEEVVTSGQPQELAVYEDPAACLGDESTNYELAGPSSLGTTIPEPQPPAPDQSSAATAYDHLNFSQPRYKPPVPQKPGRQVEEHTYDTLNPDGGGEGAYYDMPDPMGQATPSANNDDATYDTVSGQ